LGAALGELARIGMNKATFLTTESLRDFPAWVEQLLAESLSKDGKGIVPIVGEPEAIPGAYGSDRVFICFLVEGDDSTAIEKQAEALEAAGHPVIQIKLPDKISIGQQIFSWEIAVASAGSVLGVHPFNQPDVQLAKDFTNDMIDKVQKAGFDDSVAEAATLRDEERLTHVLDAWLRQAREGDYVAIQAYLPPSQDYMKALQSLRKEFQDHRGLATTLGFGPRFLHSTGQLHKGGPDVGLFLQIVDEPAEELEVPDTSYTFGALIRAQALGDFQALTRMGRHVLRIDLKRDGLGGLICLSKLVSENTEK
jgi:transaldolase/glucose-6-phosphate isomerase